MKQTYLFAGASSLIASKTAALLQKQGHRVIGISTKEKKYDYDIFFKVENYNQGSLPVLEDNLDGLIYFPGTINLKPFNRLTIYEFQHDFEINVLGAVNSIQTYILNLKKSNQSSIVLFSSVAAQSGMPFHSSIAASKGAIEALTKSLAAEFAPSIRVNAIAPSLTATPIAEKFINTTEKLEVLAKRNPLKRIGTAEELAEVTMFLLTNQSSWITGQVLAVDGGMHALKI
jgi:3-oxoacyl-[acyl-carrier protein] reductase